MPANKKVGVSDIAKRAGVAIGTVSNYLNYPERVSDTLKERIGQAIAELGYVPRRAAPAPAAAANGGEATPLVGYVMTDIEHSLFTAVFEGVQEVCEDNGMQVIGLNASSNAARQHELVRLLIAMGVAGILLSTVEDSPQDVAAAHAAGIPIVLIDHTNAGGADATCAVLENNISAGRLAAEELIGLGRRHIAFAAHSFDYESIQDRQLGVQKAVMAAGGGVTFELIDSGGLMVDDGRQLGLALSRQAERMRWSRYDDGIDEAPAPSADSGAAPHQHAPRKTARSGGAPSASGIPHASGAPAPPARGTAAHDYGFSGIPDGIVAGSDQLAVGLLQGLAEGGVLRVPDDLAVVGTEGVYFEPVTPMPLTVVQAPGIDMGRKAMAQLLDRLDNPVAHVHGTMLIEPKLIPRASTRG